MRGRGAHGPYRDLRAQRGGQKRAHELAHAEQRPEQRGTREDRPQELALQRHGPGSAHALVHHAPADVEQPPILDPRRTGRFARAAGQATVEMQLRDGRNRLPFQHLLHEIDAPARPIELIAQKLIGGTGRTAEAAVHALAQDRVCFAAFGRVLDEVGEIGLHERVDECCRQEYCRCELPVTRAAHRHRSG